MAEIKKTPNLGLAISADESIKFKAWHRLINGEGPVKENEDDETALVEKSNAELLDAAYAEFKEEKERATTAEAELLKKIDSKPGESYWELNENDEIIPINSQTVNCKQVKVSSLDSSTLTKNGSKVLSEAEVSYDIDEIDALAKITFN